MYDHVLVPTDGSASVRQAVVHGTAIAARFDATLHALSVIPEGPYGSLEGEHARAELEANADRAVERVETEATRKGVSVVTEVRRGVPDEEILAYVDDNAIDMVVMGTHGREGIDRMLVGSVTETIVRNAEVPVVTVRVSDGVSIATGAEAVRVAVEELGSRGHADPTPEGEPHRTSGSWIVPVQTADGRVHVHVDASTGETRVARLDG